VTPEPRSAALSTPESRIARWGRRAITIPGYLGLATAALLLLPVAVPLAAAVDGVRGTRLALTRTALLLGWYLVMESAGILAAGATWLARPLARSRHAAWSFRLQCLWASGLFSGARRLYGLRLEVAGSEALAGSGPILLFLRHASVADTLLPAVLVSSRTGRRLRYVMKRELLWDPCLDLVGQRLPNAFVRRGTGDAAETELVRRLALDLGPDEGVLLYPEGTRFTPERRRRVLDRLARSADAKLLERASALQWLLPPRLGGVLALLEAAPDADVVFAVHTGFEDVRSLADVGNGALIGRRIQVEFRRVPAGSIPSAREPRIEWLYDEWSRLDAWLEAHVEPVPADRPA
jgi:1-acyl-sn-glycerol-3-phosphate acyltransferase